MNNWSARAGLKRDFKKKSFLYSRTSKVFMEYLWNIYQSLNREKKCIRKTKFQFFKISKGKFCYIKAERRS